MNKNIVVTGINGFVGTNIQTLLGEKYSLIGVSRTPKANEISWAKLYEVNAEIWIHLAGKAHDLKGTARESEYIQTNLTLTKKVFSDFLQDSSAEKFIFFSSVKAVASQVDGWLTEEDKYELDNPYGKSKRLAEEYLLSQKLPEYKKLIILRPCMIHGAGNKGNLNLLYKFSKTGIPYPLAGFKNSRSFLSINNLIYIVDKIIESKDMMTGIYNVADDQTLSTNRLIEIMGAQKQKNIKLWNVHPSLIKLLAKLGDVLHLPINSHKLQKLTESYKVSNRKIKTALQIEKLPFTAEEGIVKTLKSLS
jgi:nucleoside-diphosphate-sugar epimerase